MLERPNLSGILGCSRDEGQAIVMHKELLMARKGVHALVSGMGAACSIMETLVREARDCGVPDEAIHNLTTEEGRKIIRGWVQSLKGVVQSALTLAERITACKLDWFDKDILKWRREDTPPTTLGETDVIHFGCDISNGQALAEVDRRGYRPGNIEELLDRGTKNPTEQCQYPIIALGSVFVRPSAGSRFSPCLVGGDAKRGLDLRRRDVDWGGRCRFLVVRK